MCFQINPEKILWSGRAILFVNPKNGEEYSFIPSEVEMKFLHALTGKEKEIEAVHEDIGEECHRQSLIIRDVESITLVKMSRSFWCAYIKVEGKYRSIPPGWAAVFSKAFNLPMYAEPEPTRDEFEAFLSRTSYTYHFQKAPGSPGYESRQ